MLIWFFGVNFCLRREEYLVRNLRLCQVYKGKLDVSMYNFKLVYVWICIQCFCVYLSFLIVKIRGNQNQYQVQLSVKVVFGSCLVKNDVWDCFESLEV